MSESLAFKERPILGHRVTAPTRSHIGLALEYNSESDIQCVLWELSKSGCLFLRPESIQGAKGCGKMLVICLTLTNVIYFDYNIIRAKNT